MPTVTFDSVFSWNAVSGAAGYQVRALDAVNNVLTPAPGVVDVGLSTSVSVNTLLAGQSPGTYKLQVRAVEAGGANPTGFSSLDVDLVGLAAPTGLTVA
jgi:hypothetical protein